MASKSTFRRALEAAINERHCANHPMTEAWAQGELGRDAMMGWGIEHWHWISTLLRPSIFNICAKAPDDVVAAMMDNFNEEEDPDNPHLEIVLRFAAANGADVEKVKSGRGLPTTRLWANWQIQGARVYPWYAGIACSNIASETQSPRLYSKVLPALREKYQFPEDEIEHFWLHSEVDIEHGDRAFEVLERHCTNREEQDICIHYAREGAALRWFYFDGIYLHYEKKYALMQ